MNIASIINTGIRRGLASDKFFYVVVGFLVFQALWIALSGRFPMAYDEQNHLGIIKLYVENVSPFWSSQPAGPAPFSAVSRDPSYLYHWLMSFPYRLFDVFLKNDASKVLAFRFISIGLFAAGIVLYRKLLLQTLASKPLIHTVFALFVLVPTVPFLAGQMNYDNLLFLLVAVILLLTAKIIGDIKSGQLDIRTIVYFVSLSLLTSLVKFPFLAILLSLGIWILAVFFRRNGRKGWRIASALLKESYGGLSIALRIMLVALVVVSAALFIERYGVNTLRYGTPTPECDQVIDMERCEAFGPWRRNYDIYQAKIDGSLQPSPNSDFISFATHEWLGLLTWQFFYSLNGPTDGFSVGKPLPLPYRMSMVLAAVGIIGIITYWRSVFRRPLMKGLVFVALFYALVLLAQNYADFLRLSIATAIQARYIVLVLPVLFLALGLAYARVFRTLPYAKTVLATIAIAVMLTQGGGIGVFIVRSSPLWWWENSTVIQVNQAAQRVLRPIIIGD